MTIVEDLAGFVGSWSGVNRLRLMPTDDYRESATTATVSVTARAYICIAYTWAEDGEPQDGLLLVSGGADAVEAVWADSWHSQPRWLALSGTVDEDGVVRLLGTYPAESGPDWGWQIHLEPGDGGGGRITMHNVVPGHEPYQVVEATYA